MENGRVLQEREDAVKEYSLRNANKQVMEKKRRARINTCLTQLKLLVLQGLNKDASQYSKLEKADILEMTVKYLKSYNSTPSSKSVAPRTTPQYREGFQECAKQVQGFLKSSPTSQQAVRMQLIDYLAERANGTNGKIENRPLSSDSDKENVHPRRFPLMDTKQYSSNVIKSRPMKNVCSRNNTSYHQERILHSNNISYQNNENVSPVSCISAYCGGLPAQPSYGLLPSSIPRVAYTPPMSSPTEQQSAPLNYCVSPVRQQFSETLGGAATGGSGNDFIQTSEERIGEVFPSHLGMIKSENVWRPW